MRELVGVGTTLEKKKDSLLHDVQVGEPEIVSGRGRVVAANGQRHVARRAATDGGHKRRPEDETAHC